VRRDARDARRPCPRGPFAAEALTTVRERVSENGTLSADKIEAEQHAANGLTLSARLMNEKR
jgi:hypothetical protein